jgi:hypothetical protein
MIESGSVARDHGIPNHETKIASEDPTILEVSSPDLTQEASGNDMEGAAVENGEGTESPQPRNTTIEKAITGAQASQSGETTTEESVEKVGKIVHEEPDIVNTVDEP